MSDSVPYLSKEQRIALQDLPFSVLLPTGLPGPWSLAGFEIDDSEEGVSFSLDLTAGTKMLSFLTTNEGIGDPVPGVRTSVHVHPDWGSLTIEHEEDGSCLSDWLEFDGAWSAVTGRDLGDSELDLIVPLLQEF